MLAKNFKKRPIWSHCSPSQQEVSIIPTAFQLYLIRSIWVRFLHLRGLLEIAQHLMPLCDVTTMVCPTYLHLPGSVLEAFAVNVAIVDLRVDAREDDVRFPELHFGGTLFWRDVACERDRERKWRHRWPWHRWRKVWSFDVDWPEEHFIASLWRQGSRDSQVLCSNSTSNSKLKNLKRGDYVLTGIV